MTIDFSKISILIAEDNREVRNIIVEILKVLGVGKITVAVDGKEAFKKYMHEKPDIILTDWEMHPVNGLEFIKQVRTDELSYNKAVPIIIITGYTAPNRVVSARDSGITEFLVKPFTATQLIQRIVHVINSPRNFVEAPDYKGPDRRRKTTDYNEERRGEFDIIMIEPDS